MIYHQEILTKIVIFEIKIVIFETKIVIFETKIVIFETKIVIFETKIVIFEIKIDYSGRRLSGCTTQIKVHSRKISPKM